MSPETKSDMEHDLSSAVHMVHIALTMLEKALGDRAAQESVTGRPDTYHVNAEDVDALLRALYETRNKSEPRVIGICGVRLMHSSITVALSEDF